MVKNEMEKLQKEKHSFLPKAGVLSNHMSIFLNSDVEVYGVFEGGGHHGPSEGTKELHVRIKSKSVQDASDAVTSYKQPSFFNNKKKMINIKCSKGFSSGFKP